MKVTLITNTPTPEVIIETCARISYASNNDDNNLLRTKEFLLRLLKNGYEYPFEHASATFLIEDITRACSNQIVSHRHASFSQKSDSYTKSLDFASSVRDRFFFNYNLSQHIDEVDEVLYNCKNLYDKMVESGVLKEDARLILPQAESTSLYMTANFREWRHFLKLRLDRHAQWEIREVAKNILEELKNIAPTCFSDLEPSNV